MNQRAQIDVWVTCRSCNHTGPSVIIPEWGGSADERVNILYCAKCGENSDEKLSVATNDQVASAIAKAEGRST